MRLLLALGLAVGLAGLAGAQDRKADPVGTWKLQYEAGGQRRTATLTVKRDGDKLAGTMTWPDQSEAGLKDLKAAGGELTFSADRKLMDNTFTIKYRLKVDGDTIKGKGAAEVGGQTREYEIEGKREKTGK